MDEMKVNSLYSTDCCLELNDIVLSILIFDIFNLFVALLVDISILDLAWRNIPLNRCNLI